MGDTHRAHQQQPSSRGTAVRTFYPLWRNGRADALSDLLVVVSVLDLRRVLFGMRVGTGRGAGAREAGVRGPVGGGFPARPAAEGGTGQVNYEKNTPRRTNM